MNTHPFAAWSDVWLIIYVEAHAEDALLARMSYTAYMRAVEARLKTASKLTVRQIVRVALICSFIVSIPMLKLQELKLRINCLVYR